MLKKIMKGIAIGGAALTLMASTSAADTVEVNIFGASAQFKFWTADAPKFLVNGLGCDSDDVFEATNDVQAEAGTHDRDAGIAVCVGTDGFAGISGTGRGGYNSDNDTLVLRYTTNSSYDGVMAVQDDDSFDADNCATDGDRKMADPTASELGAYGSAGDSIATLSCMDVHVGASDVSAKTFQQTSKGYSAGPLGSSASIIDRAIVYGDTLTIDPADAGYQIDRPIVVPFGFYANTDVPVDNLSRMMALNLFSGKIAKWDELSDDFTSNQQVTVCHRHAGSGTVATLNAAVFRGDATLPTVQRDGVPGSPYYQPAVLVKAASAIWFNKGSSDAVRCAGNVSGAVAYADADKCVGGCDDKYGSVKAIAYQGVGGDTNSDVMSDAIKNGRSIFWSAQYLYSNETGETKNVIDALVTFAEDPANMPGSKAAYWAAQDDMNWEKLNDFSWPTQK